MALIEDLTIKLADKHANTTDYADVRRIKVPRADGGYGLFTNLNSLRPYFVAPNGSGGYRVLGPALFSAGGFSSGRAAISFIDENAFAQTDYTYLMDDGIKAVAIILTIKNLTTGITYLESEL